MFVVLSRESSAFPEDGALRSQVLDQYFFFLCFKRCFYNRVLLTGESLSAVVLCVISKMPKNQLKKKKKSLIR